MAHLVHWVVRAMYASRVILFGLVLAQLADAFTFTVGVSRFGIALETNGIAAGLYLVAGLDGVLAAKALALLTAIAIVTYAADRFPRVVVCGGATATSFGLLGSAANTWTILALAG